MPLAGGQFTGPVMFANDPDFKASIEGGRYWQLQFDINADGSSYFGWDAVAKQVYIGLDGPAASNYFTMTQSEAEIWQPLVVPAPVNPGHAANKAYVDAHVGSGTTGYTGNVTAGGVQFHIVNGLIVSVI